MFSCVELLYDQGILKIRESVGCLAYLQILERPHSPGSHMTSKGTWISQFYPSFAFLVSLLPRPPSRLSFFFSFLLFLEWAFILENIFSCMANFMSWFLIYNFPYNVNKAKLRNCRIFLVETRVSIETLLDEKCPAGSPF